MQLKGNGTRHDLFMDIKNVSGEKYSALSFSFVHPLSR